MNRLAPLTLLTVCVGGMLLGLGQSANAYKHGEITCKQPYCGKISNVPKTSLISVNPDPLSTVDPGDPQNVTVKWSERFGLRSTQELCATESVSSGPKSADPCTALPRAIVVSNGFAGYTFEDSLVLTANFYRPTAEFYIRTTALINLIGSPPTTANSNRLAFTWPLKMPNLYAHNPDIDIHSWGVTLEHEITNTGGVDADASTTEFIVNVCDGIAMLPRLDPEDPESELVCSETNEHFLSTFMVQQPVNPIAAGVRVNSITDISGRLPSSQNGLWISITAYADAQQDVAESNENDNTRFETMYLIP